jgi:hypothetical protein
MSSHVSIYDATLGDWIPFKLWPAQRDALATITAERQVVILKARQLGLSWLYLGYALWRMLFQPAATVLFFSKRDDEAVYLLGQERLRGMFARLPDALRYGLTATADGAHEWGLSNGSSARAFPTTGGRSYTASLAIVDEADYCDDLDALLNAVKPTVDAGGQLALLSTADKSKPLSPFKRIYSAAVAGSNGYRPVFLPWSARPTRTATWYAEQQADVLARTGALDDLQQEYPAADWEALAPRSQDKRIPAAWLASCADTFYPPLAGVLDVPGVSIFEAVRDGQRYAIGADPAEGNPQSDESAASVVDSAGRQVAVLAGKFDPAVFAGLLSRLAVYYNGAGILVERNNHGHAVLLWLREHSRAPILLGLDGKPGWLTTGNSKPLAVDHATDVLRDGATRIRDSETLTQLAQLEGATLAAPAGQHDDRALAHIAALAALRWCGPLPVNLPGHGDPFEIITQPAPPGVTLLPSATGGVRFGIAPKQRAGAGVFSFGKGND